MEANPIDSRASRDRALGFLLAAVVIVAFLAFVFVPPERMNPATLPIIRFLAAIAGALSTYLFIGAMELHGHAPDTVGRLKLKAGGSFAVFVIILLLFFWGLPTSSAQAGAAHADLRVAPSPDTVTIKPDGFKGVEYVFTETRGVDVSVDTQDNQFFTETGLPLGQPCRGCRILGGSFKVRGRSTYTFVDNVYLPKERVDQLRALQSQALQLRTTYNCRDATGAEFSVTAVLKIYPEE